MVANVVASMAVGHPTCVAFVCFLIFVFVEEISLYIDVFLGVNQITCFVICYMGL